MTVATQSVSRHVVGAAADLPAGARMLVTVGRRSIGIFNVDGRLYALRNSCPHRGAPLCQGRVRGYITASGPQQYRYDASRPVLRCPWHGYEFALADGRAVYDPSDLRVRSYRVEIEDGEVVLYA